MNTTIEEQARLCAARVPDNVGIDPVTIIAIITQVLPLLLSCFQRGGTSDPAEIREAVIKENSDSPDRLRRRLARRIRGEADESISKVQSFVLAEAVIEQVIASDEEALVGFTVACQQS